MGKIKRLLDRFDEMGRYPPSRSWATPAHG